MTINTGLTLYDDQPDIIDIQATEYFLLDTPPRLIYSATALQIPFEKHQGSIQKYRRNHQFPVSGIPIEEGVTPPSMKPTYTDITVEPQQYGGWSQQSDRQIMLNRDDTVAGTLDKLGIHGSRTLDMVMRDILLLGLSTYQCEFGENNQTPTEISFRDIVESAGILDTNDATKVTEIIDADTGIATTPIQASYMAYMHTSIGAGLHLINGFTPTANYANTSSTLKSEIGSMAGVRFLTTSAGAFKGNNPKIYTTIIVGKDSHASIGFSHSLTNVYLKPLGSSGAIDPLNQRQSEGWKTSYTGIILSQEEMINVNSTMAN